MYTTREQDLVYQNEVKEIKLGSLLEITNAIDMFFFVNFYLDYLPEEWCISNAVYLLNQENSWKQI